MVFLVKRQQNKLTLIVHHRQDYKTVSSPALTVPRTPIFFIFVAGVVSVTEDLSGLAALPLRIHHSTLAPENKNYKTNLLYSSLVYI